MTNALSNTSDYSFLEGSKAEILQTPLEEGEKQVEKARFANYNTGTLALAIPTETINACSALRDVNVTIDLKRLSNMVAALQATFSIGNKIFAIVNPSRVVEYMPRVENINDFSDNMRESAMFPLEYMDGIPAVNGVPAWDLLPGERIDFYNVFKLYRDSRYFLLETGDYAITNRTIAGLSRQLGVPGITLTYISKLYSWAERCTLYDAYMELEMQKRKAQQELLIRNEHLKMAQQLTNKVWSQLSKSVANLSPKELLQALELGLKYSRISAGMLPDKPGNAVAGNQTNLSIYNTTTNNTADQMLNVNAAGATTNRQGSAVQQQLQDDMKDENNLLSILHVLQASGAMKTAVHTDLVDHGEEGLGIVDSDEGEVTE